MTAQTEPLGYDRKPADYFQNVRPEMLPFIPARCRRVLDVGCGEGAFGESLKRAREIEVWGVEPIESAAAIASTKLDRVVEGVFGPETALPAGTFDCVLFNDVLEHMIDPDAALRYARTLLAPEGVVVASIPNIRSFPTFWLLLAHGQWEYRDCGVLDKTHLRFFTRSSIASMFERQGFTLESLTGLNPFKGVPNASLTLWRAYRIASALCLGKFDDMRYQQFAVVAKPAVKP
jgi:2-polyprenyl-3-methyl-5-hydroxy-6-metoxy-1,4-benzoquinol methylase